MSGFDPGRLTGWSAEWSGYGGSGFLPGRTGRPGAAEELLDVAEDEARSTANLRAQAAAGDPVWATYVADSDFDARMDADDLWLSRMRPALVASIIGGGGVSRRFHVTEACCPP